MEEKDLNTNPVEQESQATPESEPTPEESVFETAKRLVVQGRSVIPIKLAYLPDRGKRPAIPWEEFQRRLPTQEELAEWFEHTDNQLGMVTGCISGGIFILDFDEGWEISFPEFMELFPEFQESLIVKSGGGRYHVYGRVENLSPSITKLEKKKYEDGKLAYRVELRANGHQTLVPPSIHPNRERYSYFNEAEIVTLNPARVDELLQWFNVTGKKSETNKGCEKNPEGWQQEFLSEKQEGERNESLTKLAGRYVAKGLSRGETLGFLLSANSTYLPPLSTEEVEGILDSIIKRHENRHGCKVKEIPEEFEAEIMEMFQDGWDDAGMGKIFGKLFSGEYCYIEELKNWYRFGGVNWINDPYEAEMRMVEAVDSIHNLHYKKGTSQA